MTNSEKMETILQGVGISTRRVKVLGSYVHVDTFEKYEADLDAFMSEGGFAKLAASNGRHMDSFDGFRVVYLAK